MNNKSILVTGASRGIGKAISLNLLEEGYTVIGIARQFQDPILNPRFIPITLDLSCLQELPTHLNKLAKELTIDGIVSNVGQGMFKHLEEFSYDQIQFLVNLNFLSHVFVVKAFLAQLKKQPESQLIFIGSEASLAGKRQGSIYCATKFALRGFVQALRDECATSSVRICLINPGMVKSEFFNSLSFSPGDHCAEHLLPDDIATLVTFLLKTRKGLIYDEINLSPQKKKILRKKLSL